jgi:hypothetical protein
VELFRIVWGVTRVGKRWYWLVAIEGPLGVLVEELRSGYAPTRSEARPAARAAALLLSHERGLKLAYDLLDFGGLKDVEVANHRRNYAPECEKLRERDRERREQSRLRWEQSEKRWQEIFDRHSALGRRGGPGCRESLQVLGLSPPVTRDEIRTAFLNLARVHHPDAGGDAEAFVRIESAYRSALLWAEMSPGSGVF